MNALNLAKCVLIAMTLSLVANDAEARPVKSWTKAELMEQADLVVIATPIGSQEGQGVPSADNGWVVPVETTFRIDMILKGKIGKPAGALPRATVAGPKETQGRTDPDIRITVGHQRLADSHPPAVDGPMYVRFDGMPRDFLLFLKRTAKGELEPLSGQHDPALSIFVVKSYTDPLPDELKPAKPERSSRVPEKRPPPAAKKT